MGKKLPSHLQFLHIGCLFLFLSLGTSELQAQVSITGITPHEIMFTSGNTRILEASARISLADMDLLTPDNTEAEQWYVYGENEREAGNYYVEGANGSVSVGKTTSGSDSYFSVSYINNSEYDFESLNLAFDFIHLHYTDQTENSLYSLHSRINNSEWKLVEGGEIHSSVLSPDEEGWNSFSVQLHLDAIYLRKNDQVDFKWVQHQENSPLPLAVQRVEFSPEASNRQPVKRGSLVITEILPQAGSEGLPVEYIELYNPKDKPVSIKGLVIKSETGEIVIQDNKTIEPYSYFLVASQGAARLDEITPDYTYTGSLIAGSRGAVTIEFLEQELAKATYQSPEQGVALELSHVKDSYDGYSSMDHLEPSLIETGSGLRGSPGTSGSTKKLFTREIQQPGWYLLSAPGQFIDGLNRNITSGFSTPGNDPFNPGELSVSEPFLVYKENEDTVTLFIEEPQAGDVRSFSRTITSHAVVAGFPLTEAIEVGQITNGNDERAAPVLQTWSNSEQRFKLLHDELDTIEGWEPVILNRSVSESLQIDTTGRSSGPRLNRYLQFRLYEETGNSRSLLDDTAIVGFLRTSNQQDVRYDLPKLLPFHDTENPADIRSLIYLSSSESGQVSSSFSHFPYELDQKYSLGLGHFTVGRPGNFTLDWSQVEDIPDEWVFTLEDTFTGNIVDMKEQTHYTFRSSGGDFIEPDEENASVYSEFKPEQKERFIITLEPYEDVFSAEEEREEPGDVELHQNYPNPFNPATTISFYLPEERAVKLGVYNVVGQQVAMLIDETVRPGEHSVTWNASDMPSGIYIVQLEMGNRMLTRKITLIK